jgi:1-deoxy-D-xylulose 5-phosphate reductoisomerase
MKFKIVKINNLSGSKAGVYSVVLNGDEETLLNKFVRETKFHLKVKQKTF